MSILEQKNHQKNTLIGKFNFQKIGHALSLEYFEFPFAPFNNKILNQQSAIRNIRTTRAMERKNGEPARECLKFEHKLGNVYEK